MNLLDEAEEILREMDYFRYTPFPNDFKCILYAHGICGHFQEMEGTLNLVESCGHSIDTITINMILSCYGSYHEYKIIKSCVRRMQVDNGKRSKPTKSKSSNFLH